ncbi:hypothetical protein GY45DRAFT_1315207 [Cubamyces sp. BRFM 1775]|nr:hypothetical protein GY45DRAFT_1315207 [Cubamyces sp. BRFM 1775]
MFKFGFDVDEVDQPIADAFAGGHPASGSANSHTQNTVREDPSKEIPIEDLLAALPHTFSFSPFAVPLVSKRTVVLARRDLFDARFQLIASDEDAKTTDGRSDLDFLDAPSDLVPGVYEGGLKTWECSLDLVDCLDSIYGTEIARHLKGKRVLELGCGTSIPSLYLLRSIFAAEPLEDAGIEIHLQDYNELVLRLVTLPNVILSWYMSSASAEFRSSVSSQTDVQMSDNDAEAEPLPTADATEPGEMPITRPLLDAFLASLRKYGVQLKFFSGSWATFDVQRAGGPYQLVLTSETIYRTDSLPSLVDLLQRATAKPPPKETPKDAASLTESTAKLSLTNEAALQNLREEPSLCLVAAKVVYFGVGGGVNEFIHAVESPPSSGSGGKPKGVVRTVWERIYGVKRAVMQVLWN